MPTKAAVKGGSGKTLAQAAVDHSEKKKDGLANTDKNKALQKGAVSNEMLLADQGAGAEGIGAKDMAIPRISILQSNSPQVKKSEGAYIKGAEEGDFFDNVANEVIAKGEEGLILVPVSYRRANIEWIPKSAGGGFIADHGGDDAILSHCSRDEDNRMMLKNGHEIVTTAEYYCYVLTKDGAIPKQAVISLAKTQLKKARKLNTQITSLQVPRPGPNNQGTFNPAMFYSSFLATSVPESNDKGSWMGWSLPRHSDTLELKNGQELYLAARSFREQVQRGAVKVAAPSDQGASQTETGDPDNEKF